MFSHSYLNKSLMKGENNLNRRIFIFMLERDIIFICNDIQWLNAFL